MLKQVIIKHGLCNCIIRIGHLMTFSSKSWREQKIYIVKQVKKPLQSILKTLQLSHSQTNTSNTWEVLLQLCNIFSKELYLRISFSLKTKHKYFKALFVKNWLGFCFRLLISAQLFCHLINSGFHLQHSDRELST